LRFHAGGFRRFVVWYFGKVLGECFRMIVSRWVIAGGVTVALLLVSAVAMSETDHASTSSKSTSPRTEAKDRTSSTAHHSVKSTSPKSHTASTNSRKGKKSKKASRRGQEKIDSGRARQIQEALVRQHYLSGEPSGKWDADSEDAMRRYQADNGWQDKTVPDSRALIKLGLGPNHDHLLNPESAMTNAPESSHPAAARPNPPGPATPPNQPQQ
jgi:hypothetical protein